MKKILIAGAGNMGSWFVEALCLDHEVAVFDLDTGKLRYFFNCHKIVRPEEIPAFGPELMINAVNLQHTIKAFDELMPYLPGDCIIADIASVKNGLHRYYLEAGRRFVSTHPMFGPTFANIRNLSGENAIIITESDQEGRDFFRQFYSRLQLNIFDYSFREHDQTIAYSLSVPFVSTMVFAACMKKIEVPGTTFKKHFDIAGGLMAEDNFLLSEILMNPYTMEQIEKIRKKLEEVVGMIREKDTGELHSFFDSVRNNLSL